MIQLYTGTPGSGKSLHLARQIVRKCSVRRKCVVVCNFDVNTSMLKYPDRFIYLPNSALDPGRIRELAEDFFVSSGLPLEEDRIFVYIDEAQVVFNSRTWQDKNRLSWVEFFSQHRKYGVSCVLVAQNDMMIDKQIRALVEYEVAHRKVSNYGSIGFFLQFLFFGHIFVAVERWYSADQRIGSFWFRDSLKLHGLYDTFSRFNADNS